MKAHENTRVRLLSCCAHGSTAPLITDVTQNSGRQETKLPAVPPHYNVAAEGCPAAGTGLVTRAGP